MVGNRDQRQPRQMKNKANKNDREARKWKIKTDSCQGSKGSRLRKTEVLIMPLPGSKLSTD